MEIETRKVQITGGSTYVISLPKKWINKVKIKSGDGIGIAIGSYMDAKAKKEGKVI